MSKTLDDVVKDNKLKRFLDKGRNILNLLSGTCLYDIRDGFIKGLKFDIIKKGQRIKSSLIALKNTAIGAATSYIILPLYIATHEALHSIVLKLCGGEVYNIAFNSRYAKLSPLCEIITKTYPSFEKTSLETGVPYLGVVLVDALSSLQHALASGAPYILTPLGIYLFEKGIEKRNPVILGLAAPYAFAALFASTRKHGDMDNIASITGDSYIRPILSFLIAAAIYGASKGLVYGVKKIKDKLPKINIPKWSDILVATALLVGVEAATIPYSGPTHPELSTAERMYNFAINELQNPLAKRTKEEKEILYKIAHEYGTMLVKQGKIQLNQIPLKPSE